MDGKPLIGRESILRDKAGSFCFLAEVSCSYEPLMSLREAAEGDRAMAGFSLHHIPSGLSDVFFPIPVFPTVPPHIFLLNQIRGGIVK